MHFVINSGSLTHLIGTLKFIMLQIAIGFPQEAWWAPLLVIVILVAAAFIDSISSTVPDPLIIAGLIAIILLQGHYVSWVFAERQVLEAVGVGFTVWAANALWFKTFKVDAIGMGDAKWSALAVACFGIVPLVIAWGVGAWLGLIWLGLLRLGKFEITRVYFTPFLVVGLTIGLWWDRLRLILI